MTQVPAPLLILVVTLMTIGSQLILKKAVTTIVAVLRTEGILAFLVAAATSPWVWLALTLQGIGYIVWLFVIAGERLSVAFAISGSFFYILMAGLSWYFFGERLGALQWVGLCLISCGVLLITLTPKV